MTVSSIDPANGVITLNNEDNDVTLGNDMDISLMDGMFIKTADPSWEEGDWLRYYPYSEVSIDHFPEEFSSGGKA